jgi:tRNA (adenine22-N1)-methyltransferase
VRLEPRLQTVADLIQARAHADIGSDHALLPRFLLEAGRVEGVIVVEKHQGPFDLARKNLQDYPQAEVRFGDGLEPLREGEVASLSMSGMGAPLMTRILEAHPTRVPPRLVLQPNARPELLRQWALTRKFHLTREVMVRGFWWYTVLALEHREGADPAYEGVPVEAALQFGPLLLKEGRAELLTELQAQIQYIQGLGPQQRTALQERQRIIEQALSFLHHASSHEWRGCCSRSDSQH